MTYFKKIQLFVIYFLLSLLLFNCKSDTTKDKNYIINKIENKQKKERQDSKLINENIPQKAFQFCDLIKKNKFPKNEYVGGRKFKNLERNLRIKDSFGKKINYQEWDINKKIKGKNRGKERLVSGSDGTCYYTNNHYKSFILVSE